MNEKGLGEWPKSAVSEVLSHCGQKFYRSGIGAGAGWGEAQAGRRTFIKDLAAEPEKLRRAASSVETLLFLVLALEAKIDVVELIGK